MRITSGAVFNKILIFMIKEVRLSRAVLQHTDRSCGSGKYWTVEAPVGLHSTVSQSSRACGGLGRSEGYLL